MNVKITSQLVGFGICLIPIVKQMVKGTLAKWLTKHARVTDSSILP